MLCIYILTQMAPFCNTKGEFMNSCKLMEVFGDLIARGVKNEPNIDNAISIDVGKVLNKDSFISYLSTKFDIPIVHLDDNMLRISSMSKKNGGAVVINLDLVRNVSITEYHCKKRIDFGYAVDSDLYYRIELITRNW